MKKIIAYVAQKKLNGLVGSLDDEVTIVRRLLLLEMAVLFLAGIIIGMIFSPHKTTQFTIASGNNINSDDDDSQDDDKSKQDGKKKKKPIQLQ